MENLKIFSGTANLPLAKKVAKELGVELGKAEIIRFADTECRVWVEEDVRDKTAVLIQPFSPPVDENLVEFLLLADALKREKPKKLIAAVPYYGYARQDKVFRKGEPLSAEVVVKTIEAVGVEALITVHLHSLKILPFFKIPVTHLSTVPVFTSAFDYLAKEKDHWVAVAPDEMAAKWVRKFAQNLGLEVAILAKKRNYSQKDKPRTTGLLGKVSGKNCLMFDDLSSTGGTIVGGAKLLKEDGAQKILVVLTHLVTGQAAERILEEKAVEKLIVTDTILQSPRKKLEVVSVAPLIAEAIVNSVECRV